MAADTPQMDTALASMVDISGSILSLRAIQKAKYHTLKTTMSDCRIPKSPALRISEMITEVPSTTSPALMKNSLCIAGRNHSGMPIKLLITKPMATENSTDSRPSVLMAGIRVMYIAPAAIAKITAKEGSRCRVSRPINRKAA